MQTFWASDALNKKQKKATKFGRLGWDATAGAPHDPTLMIGESKMRNDW